MVEGQAPALIEVNRKVEFGSEIIRKLRRFRGIIAYNHNILSTSSILKVLNNREDRALCKIALEF